MPYAAISSAKIGLPRLRTELVSRPQLQAALSDALARRKLVLLSAPAGYGKTVALVQQLARLPEGHAVAWVSASEDEDLQRFLAALLGMLDPFDLPWRVSPDALPAMALERTGAVVDELAHALALAEVTHGVMALDDMHRIADPRVFKFLDRLLEVLPPRWTVAITSRVDPPLALARMLVQQEVAEFREAQLRFQREDVQVLLQTAGRESTPELVEQMLLRTQGWAVGLGIEVMTQARSSQQHRARRRMFEYLAQEVLEQLPQPMVVFLLRCSVLPVLTAKRCAEVSGDAQAAHWLAELERRDLFVTMLDEEDLTLRLHDVFREFLEGQLAREHIEELPQLLRRAAAGEPDLVPRVGYLLRAGAEQDAARDMQSAAAAMIEAGFGEQLMRLIEQFPEPLRWESPELAYVRGLCAWQRLGFNTMQLSMRSAMEGFERNQQWQLAIQARGLASVGLYYMGRLTEAFRLWDAAPSAEMEPATEAVSALLAFMRSAQYGPPESTPACLMRLVRLIPVTSFLPLHRSMYMGRWGLRRPMQALVDALLTSDARPGLRLTASQLQAGLALWQGDTVAARALCRDAAQEARWQGEPTRFVVPHQVLTAMERSLSGDWPEARRILQGIAQAADHNPERRSKLLYANLLGGFAAAFEDWPAANQALQTIESGADDFEWPYVSLAAATLRAELALHGHDASQALALLRPLVHRAMDGDLYGVNVRLRVALSRAEQRSGSSDAAWEALGPAVDQAMDAGEPLGLLLCGPTALEELARARWLEAADAPALAYLRECAQRARELRTDARQSAAAPPSDGSLSERELQVMTLVAQGKSNKLIARELALSPHTVKRHMARIFDKTGRSSRGEVAAWYRAQDRRSVAAVG